MPVFVDALIGDTTHLSAEEFGAYCLILFRTWANNGQALQDDDRRLCRVCHIAPQRWPKVRAVISEFFDLSGGTWRQKRLITEWNRVENFVVIQRQKGIKSAQARALKNIDQQSTAVEIRLKSGTNLPSPSPKEDITNVISNAGASRAVSKSGDFDLWWEGYPEKVGKGAARKAFVKALTKTSLDQLTAGIDRYKAHKPIDRPWCNPATWLNQERWTDAYSNGHDNIPITPAMSDSEREDLKRRMVESFRAGKTLEP
jgi:uncharacterized protein YdaU (DUF1376 family)